MNTQQNCWWTLSLYQQWSLASCDTRDTTLQAILTGSTCLPHEVIQVCKTNFVSANCTYSNPLFQMILAHHHPPPYQVWLQKISSGQSGTDGHGNSRIFIKFKQSWEQVESWLQHEQSNGWKFAAPPPPPPHALLMWVSAAGTKWGHTGGERIDAERMTKSQTAPSEWGITQRQKEAWHWPHRTWVSLAVGPPAHQRWKPLGPLAPACMPGLWSASWKQHAASLVWVDKEGCCSFLTHWTPHVRFSSQSQPLCNIRHPINSHLTHIYAVLRITYAFFFRWWHLMHT